MFGLELLHERFDLFGLVLDPVEFVALGCDRRRWGRTFGLTAPDRLRRWSHDWSLGSRNTHGESHCQRGEYEGRRRSNWTFHSGWLPTNDCRVIYRKLDKPQTLSKKRGVKTRAASYLHVAVAANRFKKSETHISPANRRIGRIVAHAYRAVPFAARYRYQGVFALV